MLPNDLLQQLRDEWRRAGRTPEARRALSVLAARGAALPASVRDLTDLVAALEPSSGLPRLHRARVVAALLAASGDERLLRRCLLQTLLPGIVSVARQLRFGDGVWDEPRGFLADAVFEATVLIDRWAGQARPYAAPDLLSALRCRMRRVLLADKARRAELSAVPDREALHDDGALVATLARDARDGVTDVDLVYARGVLGWSWPELAAAASLPGGVVRRRTRLAARPYLVAPS